MQYKCNSKMLILILIGLTKAQIPYRNFCSLIRNMTVLRGSKPQRKNLFLLIALLSIILYKYQYQIYVQLMLLKVIIPELLMQRQLTEVDKQIAYERDLETVELIEHYGYPAEEYNVVTEDGFILKLFRIPYGRKNNTGRGIPILLSHGAVCSSLLWISNAEKSLGFILADQGYDVWLANFRGNHYNMEHLTLTPNDHFFWEGSVEKIAAFDVPAIVDYIIAKTNYGKIMMIGHSLGSTYPMIASIIHPELLDKVKGAILLAPASTARYFTSPFLLSIIDIFTAFPAVEYFFHKSFFGDQYFNKFLTNRCSTASSKLCFWFFGLNIGFDFSDYVNQTRIPIQFRSILSGMSIYSVYHWAQLHWKYGFVLYDYGEEKNLNFYGQATPLHFDPSKFKAPVAIFQWANDPLTTPIDTYLSTRHMPNVIYKELISNPSGSHFGMFLDESPHVSSKILELLSTIWENY